MFKRRFSFILTFLLIQTFVSAQNLKSPDQFLPHKLGEHFTPHHLLADYFSHVAENSNRMTLLEYGKTSQGRPLLLATISTPENLSRIEDIRQAHLSRTGLSNSNAAKNDDIAVVWLSFGVHGNEAGVPESALASVYELANPANARTGEWLKNAVVLFDPCLNPDGYSRYTHWYRNVSNKVIDPNPSVREHNEPWPGGRVNHYLFDLNRDWAWQTQVETQQRIKQYHRWMPHVHVDFHEMYHNDPYYFAPAAAPYHQFITDWQGEFQMEVGKNHSRYFDEKGWLYFTREVFDLFYPSYGDTYPTFNGAIGMTYEQGGHSRAGRAIDMENGDTLKLIDRIEHHVVAALSTVEVSAKNARRLNEHFDAYFKKSNSNPVGTYRSYVIKQSNSNDRIKALVELLDRNGIQYGTVEKPGRHTAYVYDTGKEESVNVEKGDLLISAYQPMSVLVQVLFEPETYLSDSLTYDITAWSLPYAYGLEAYALTQKIDNQPGFTLPSKAAPSPQGTPYTWLFRWESLDDARLLGSLMQAGVQLRCASLPFEIEGQRYNAGTLLITRADNKPLGDQLEATISGIAKQFDKELISVSTGFSKWGPDFGSEKMRLLKKAKVLALSGESVSVNSFGQVWHYFEQDLDYPLSIIDAKDFNSKLLSNYNVLIMTDGFYSRTISSDELDEIKAWIRDGGRLIAVGSALSLLEDKSGFTLKKYATDGEKSEAKKARENEALSSRLNHYSGRERRSISNSTPGAIYKLKMDNSHPLGFGLPDYYFSIKTTGRAYKHLKNTWNVGHIDENPLVIGFAGSKVKERMTETTVFGVQSMGRGQVIYMVDNPLFRGFWENGKFLFSNAVFLVQ
ncbi:MAG: M14 family metallopeptidase [Bacteroidota bacterium]